MAKTPSKPISHVLVPKHEKLSEKEKKTLLETYHVTLKELPKIDKNDPAIVHLNVEYGDVIKITRASNTSGTAIYYRGVANG